MSKELITNGNDFVLEWVERAYVGARRTVMQVNGLDGSVVMGGLSIDKNGVVSINGAAVAGTVTDNLTVAAGKSITFAAGSGGLNANAATGAIRLGGASATVGFFGVAASAKASAYTQTYSTAAKTVAAATTHTITDSSTGTPSTSALAAMTGVDGAGSNAAPLTATKNNIATLGAELALANADIVALKKVVNALVDDLQAYGLVG